MASSPRFAIVASVIFLLLSGLFFLSQNKAIPQDIKLHPAPEVSLKDYNGRAVQLSDFRGKPLLINTWATWCPFCKEELPDLVKIQKELGDKVAIIAINREEPLETAKRYSDEFGLSDKLVFLLDPDDSFYKSIGGFSMPETIFVNKDGLIVFHKRGPMGLEEIRRRMQDSLGL